MLTFESHCIPIVGEGVLVSNKRWLSPLFKGVCFVQRNARQARLLFLSLVNIEQLTPQCWPSLHWGRFNKTLHVTLQKHKSLELNTGQLCPVFKQPFGFWQGHTMGKIWPLEYRSCPVSQFFAPKILSYKKVRPEQLRRKLLKHYVNNQCWENKQFSDRANLHFVKKHYLFIDRLSCSKTGLAVSLNKQNKNLVLLEMI